MCSVVGFFISRHPSFSSPVREIYAVICSACELAAAAAAGDSGGIPEERGSCPAAAGTAQTKVI